MENKEALHYLKVLKENNCVYQLEIRQAINIAIRRIREKLIDEAMENKK